MEVSGYVYYSPSSCAADITEDTTTTGAGAYAPITILAQKGIPGIPIILISNVDYMYACVLTDIEGKYTFTNVDNGMYKVIEAFGYETSYTQSTIDYNAEKQLLKNPITPKDPTIKYMLEKNFDIYGANRVVSLYPNLVNIEVRENNILDTSYMPYRNCNFVNFKDAPQRCDAIVISDFLDFQNAVVKGENLVQDVDGGTFGSVPFGSIRSGQYSLAYTTSEFSDFQFVGYGPSGPSKGEATITNIAASSSFDKSWFDSSDHTEGNEKGRFMIVNGDVKGKIFFRTNIKIQGNTVYLFSCWVMNIMRCPDSTLPEFGIRIYDAQSKQELFYKSFNKYSRMVVTQIPTWKQIGTIITPDSLYNKTDLIIEFISEGDEAAGNDYAIDDITIVALKRGVVAHKSIEQNINDVELGGKIKYICTVSNLNDNEAITHVMFKDLLQEGVSIDKNSLTISCSEIVDEPFEMEEMPNYQDSIDNVGINIGKILSELVSSNDPNYVPLKLEKIPVGLTVTIKFIVIINSINKIEPYNNVRNRFRVQFLSELDSQDTSRPRTVASNEVITPVIFPDIKVNKSLWVLKNGVATEVEQGGSVYVGSEVIYLIKIINSGKASVSNMSLKDKFDKLFLYEFSTLPECSIKVTTQITSPINLKQEEEQKVICADILPYDNHGIEIKNISVPAATDTEKGICIIKIYGKIKL